MKTWLLFCLLFSPLAGADLAHFNLVMIGTILKESCDIDAGSKNQTVHIGDFSENAFKAIGDVSTEKAFTIELTKCSPDIINAAITFTGAQDGGSDPSLLALSDTGGTGNMAKGVAVQLLDEHGDPLAVNSLSPIRYTLHGGSNSLNFALRYKATAHPVTLGNASAVLYFAMDYE